ncbi:ABZJ_00895 family protein [Achromobacter ruhlandii]|uniref:ABZJ_00895 family protein n=1 Tax=Achromobacter ruhlandii TaxID=72557 RepID=UPI0014660E00|nr:ABZJ_00895 family protein [Achromobacter ruhlandii]CAB3844293.1 hypothetical protein LMG1864_01419 [Achromobacter ruhlandii]
MPIFSLCIRFAVINLAVNAGGGMVILLLGLPMSVSALLGIALLAAPPIITTYLYLRRNGQIPNEKQKCRIFVAMLATDLVLLVLYGLILGKVGYWAALSHTHWGLTLVVTVMTLELHALILWLGIGIAERIHERVQARHRSRVLTGADTVIRILP